MFGALVLLDLSSFIITLPQRLYSAKLSHPGRNQSRFVKGLSHNLPHANLSILKIFQFRDFVTFFNPSPFLQFLSQTLHLLDSGPSLMCHQGYCFKTCQNFKTCPYRCLKVVGRICPPPQQPGEKNAVANRVKNYCILLYLQQRTITYYRTALTSSVTLITATYINF